MLSLENDQSSWLVEGLPTLTTHTWWHMPIILAFWSWEKEVWKFKAGPGLLAQWVRALAAIPEDLGSAFITHPTTPLPGGLMPSWVLHECGAHAHSDTKIKLVIFKK